jgi:hypothetical protein
LPFSTPGNSCQKKIGMASRAPINPVFAQFETVLLCRFLAVKDRALDAFDFYNRAEATYTKSL